ENGRLDVRANMPTIGKAAALTIECATGMPEDAITAWTRIVSAGLPDGYIRPGGAPVAAPPTPAAKTPPTTPTSPTLPAPAATEPNPFDFRGAAAVPMAVPVKGKVAKPGTVPLATPAKGAKPGAAKEASAPAFFEDEKLPATPSPTPAGDNPFK